MSAVIDDIISEMRQANAADDDFDNAMNDNTDGDEDEYVESLQAEFDKHRAKALSFLDKLWKISRPVR